MELFIKTTEEIRDYVPANVSFDFKNVKPFLQLAQDKYIYPFLDQDFYQELWDGYNTNSLTDKLKQVLYHAQNAIVNIGFMLYIPHGNVQVSSSGIHIATNEQKKTAFSWQVNQLRDSHLNIGYNAIDDLLLYLESNIQDPEFVKWKNGSGVTLKRESLIQSAVEFSKYVNIKSSRRVFMLLYAIMQRIEREIPELISEELFEEIITQVKNTAANSVSLENQKLLTFIKPFIAFATIAKAANEISLQITDQGITIVESYQTIEKKSIVDDARLINLINDSRHEASKAKTKLEAFLNDNADTYPLFKNSSLYQGDDEDDSDLDDSKILLV
ncbi:DUF6712 family protein [Chondrinema litorale]|uniref:DUF6712 family protein n=1 Tax=Chondrinema litorale TaxID=2994555 RepID=UPI002543B2CA|nr:DUF6712 family protein [Chondrinema litorale]UZR95935.1 hypothetical protein OQ292_08930 [Chondrinema litorale]